MSVEGTFTVTLSGPAEGRSQVLEALASASIAARATGPDRTGAGEEAKGWVQAEFHEGTDSPGTDFQQEYMARAAAVAGTFGYEHRSHGVTVAGAAQMLHVINRRTGNVVMKHFGEMPEGAASILSEALGIPEEFIEITEPPGLWEVPQA